MKYSKSDHRSAAPKCPENKKNKKEKEETDTKNNLQWNATTVEKYKFLKRKTKWENRKGCRRNG